MIYPMNNTMTKSLAALAWVMLFANVFLPTGVAFAEEGAPIVPDQVKSQETEKVSNEQWEVSQTQSEAALQAETPAQQGGGETFSSDTSVSSQVQQGNQEKKAEAESVQTKALDQIAEGLPNQEIPAELIAKWGVNVEESSSSSTLVNYYSVYDDELIPLLMKEDWTVDYKATQGQYPDTVQWYLKEKSQVVDFGWEKVVFNKWGYPLFEKKDSIYRKALKNPGSIKNIPSSLSYDLEASLKGEWTPLDSFVKYAEVKNVKNQLVWYFLITPQEYGDFVYAPVAGEAKIGNQGFLTLQDAIDSANDGDTIVLTKDISAGKALYTTAVGAHVCTAGSSEQKTTWPKKVTIDFQGHTYNVDDAVGSCGTESQAAHFEKWSEITLKNWTLTSNNAHVHMIIQNYSKLTLENFTLDAADLESLPVYAISDNFWELNVHGDSHINAGEWGIAFDLWYWMSANYDGGVSVKFASDFVGSVDGDIEYGPADRVKTAAPNWEEKAMLSIEGNWTFGWSIKASNWNDLKKANIIVKSGLFSNDVTEYTVNAKCSIKNADSKYEVKDCPAATNFYTSNGNAIPVVLDGTTIKLEETRAVLRKLVLTNSAFSSNELIGAVLVLPSLKNVVEIKEVEGEKLLFVNNAKEKTTQVFREKTDGIFGANAFKNNTETEGKSADISFDLKNAIAPSWVDKNEAIKSYNVVMTGGKEIWYTLHTKEKFGRFYAPKNYTITFDTNGGSKVEKITQGYGTAVTAPANPTRRCHRFRWWSPALPATMPAENITLKAQWSFNTCGGDGWGGSSSSVSSSSVTTWTTSSVNTGANQPVKPKVEVRNYSWDALPSLCSAEGSSFSEEQNQAYLWACGKDITTIRAISGARLDQPLTRAELAKMMSVYVTKVLGKQPVLTGVAQYPDVDSKMGDLADYIQLAYQLQIMGIHHDGTALTYFEPNKFVTRAEFATVFSRVLYGAKYNQDGKDWANGHLNALKEAGILKNITPNMLELRGRVLLMLQRSTVAK